MQDLNRIKQNCKELIRAISRLGSTGVGSLLKITINFEGLAIIEFTGKKGFATPQQILNMLVQSKRGALGALECLDSVTIRMIVEIDNELVDVGIDLTIP